MRDERGLTTLEYIIGAAVILVVLAAAVTVWNNGLAAKIGQLVQQLMGTS
jgi:Flp pilus assembly pilin Flp